MEQRFTELHFGLGQTIVTPDAKRHLDPDDITYALRRHTRCDWGEKSDYDAWMNDRAIDSGLSVCSPYTDRHGTSFRVTTEGDFSRTTVELQTEK